MTPVSAFNQQRGDRILKNRETDTSVGGALKACDALGIEAVPLLVAMAQPSGTIERAAFDQISSEILSGLNDAAPLDAIFLDLHGAGVVEGIGEQTLAEILELERADGIIDISWFHGFPYTDVPQVGVHIVVTTEEDQAQAEKIAKQVGNKIWQDRDKFRPNSLSAEEVLQVALGSNAFPVVINETSDNCGGGAPGDGTHLLRAMLEANMMTCMAHHWS